MKLIEIEQNLFNLSPSKYYYVHAASCDCAMGKGIAAQFVNKYAGMKEFYLNENPSLGEAILYKNVFTLFTKYRYYSKPTLSVMEKCLQALKNQVENLGIRYIAMPRIGTGLDRLDWKDVLFLIEKTFGQTDINIAVCVFPGFERRV